MQGLDDDPIDKFADVEIPDPVEQFFEKVALDRELAKGGQADPAWNEEIFTLEKRATQVDFGDIDADAKIYAKRLKEEWGV